MWIPKWKRFGVPAHEGRRVKIIRDMNLRPAHAGITFAHHPEKDRVEKEALRP